MKLKTLLATLAASAVIAFTAPVMQAMADDDPGPAAYEAAMKGKRVALVPLAMGFDLAQGWAAILKREVEAFGGTFETRDPNWSTEAGAQAITEAIDTLQARHGLAFEVLERTFQVQLDAGGGGNEMQ